MSKYNGTIEFHSRLSLFLFKTARFLARLSLICGIISGFVLLGRDIGMTKPTLADAAPAIAFVGSWLVLKIAMSLWIRKSMREMATKRGKTFRQHKQEARKGKWRTEFELSKEGKYPKTKRGQALREQDSLKLHWHCLNDNLRTAPIWERRLDRTEEELSRSMERLSAAQEKGQSIVDQCSHEYAVKEYAALNGFGFMKVHAMLREENGEGPVTDAVDALYRSVHFQYEAYFTNAEDGTWKDAFQGIEEYRGLDGRKRRINTR